MYVIYECKHCSDVVGSLNQQYLTTSVLNFNSLTPMEKTQMIEQKQNGDIHVKVICESCEEALRQHPYYYELDYFIQ